MTKLPLLFGRSELVEGNGFLARVIVSGQALLSEEDGQFWTEGVASGGFAAAGATREASLAKFCEEFALVLFDIAAEASGFESFKEEVEQFFRGVNAEVLSEWNRAVEEVRAGHVDVGAWRRWGRAQSCAGPAQW